MPRIKRWFPVSQDINSDPDVWVLRNKYGEKSLSIWLEILSIADRNDGELPGDFEQLIAGIASKCRTNRTRVRLVFDYARTSTWLELNSSRVGVQRESSKSTLNVERESSSGLRVAKYAKYHRTWELKGDREVSSPNLSEPNLTKPNLSKKKTKKILARAEGFDLFWKAYPRKIGHGKAKESWDKIRPSKELTEKILRAIETAKKSHQWTKERGQFIPYPATWLNQGRYDDEPESKSQGPIKSLAQITKEAEERSRRKREEK